MRGLPVSAVLLGVACSTTAPPEQPITLILDGPELVRVDGYGPVTTPEVQLSDGSVAPINWVVANPEVAQVREGQLIAIGAGESRVHTSWQAQQVGFTLVVKPAISLHFVEPPASIMVGVTAPLQVAGHIGDQPTAIGPLEWSSSTPSVATIQAGRVTAIAPGVVYITAYTANSRAMLELAVVPAPGAP